MKSSTLFWLVALTRTTPIFAQTFTKCNPLTTTCLPDPALGKSTTIDFTSGKSSDFTASGSPTYSSQGVGFTVAKSGDSPTLTSNWYMMFGKVEVVLKVAPGVGIVSTMVLQSDDLDEIDWEWLGSDNAQAQSNYFGKGQTTTYNRGAFHPNPGAQNDFHTYSIEFTAAQVVWQIDGVTVRAMTPASANAGQYPQTPMQLKLGTWSGGDAANPPGTVQWAGGSTNYASGPYTMYVKSVKATDYSTGSSYSYGDNSGSSQSIKASGGTIGSGSGSSGGGPPAASNPSSAAAPAPSVAQISSGAPAPFGGTHRDTTSTYSTPNVWPWVASTTLITSVVPTSQPGIPSGWTASTSGTAVATSAALSTSPPVSSTSVDSSSSPSAGSDSNNLITGSGTLGRAAPSATGSVTVSISPPIANGAARLAAQWSGFCVTSGIIAGAWLLLL